MSEERILLKLEIQGTDEQLRALGGVRAEMQRIREILKDKAKLSGEQIAIEEANLKRLKDEYRVLSKEIIAQNEAIEKGSQTLAQMKAAIARLNKELDDTKVGTERFKEIQKQIRRLNDEVGAAERATGNFRRNVGNYAGDIQRVFGMMGVDVGKFGNAVILLSNSQILANKSTRAWIAGLSGLQKAIIATGIGALIVAIGVLIANLDKLTGLFKTNAEKAKEFADKQAELTKRTREYNDLLLSQVKQQELLGATEKETHEARQKIYQSNLEALKKQLEALKAAQIELEQRARSRGFFSWIVGRKDKEVEPLKEIRDEILRTKKEILNTQNTIIENDRQYTDKIKEQSKKRRESLAAERAAYHELLIKQEEFEAKLHKEIIKNTEERIRLRKQEEQEYIKWKNFLIPFPADDNVEEEFPVWAEKVSAQVLTELGIIEEANQKIITSYHERFKALDYLLSAQMITEEQYAQRRQELEQEVLNTKLEASEYALGALKTFLGESTLAGKLAAVAQAIINTYLAATQALRDNALPNTFAKIAAMIGIIATGLAQVAKIKAVKAKFAGGVIGIHGIGTETSDSIDAKISKGESVITAKATRVYWRDLAAMERSVGNKPNIQIGNRRYASGIIAAGSGIVDVQDRKLIDAINSITKIPVVVVEKDITDTQARVRKIKVAGNII